MLDRHEIEAFLTLVEELHFGRTAERLHVSTSRISQTIAKLERRVGVPLFNRTSRRVEPTALGRRLYDAVRPEWDRITEAVQSTIEAGRGLSGTLRIAFVGAAGGQFMLAACDLFRSRHPECEVLLREAQMVDVFPWLHSGEADIGLATVPVDDDALTAGPTLIAEARMLAVPLHHPFARRKSIDPEDLAHAPMIQLPGQLAQTLRDRVPRATPSGRTIPTGPVAATFNELLTLIGAGKGVFPVGAHTRRYYVRPDVAYVPMTDTPPLEWGLLWRTDAFSARIRAFGQAALEQTTPPRGT